jgi:prepilin-type N-terminal cleavage/methylation domain-containing protein
MNALRFPGSGRNVNRQGALAPCRRSARAGFTLIELLVTITIIGILAGMSLAGMSIAYGRAKQVKTKSTIAKLHSQVMQRWESYRSRRSPLDARALLLNTSTPQYANAWSVISALAANLNTSYGGTAGFQLSQQPLLASGFPNPNYPTPAQVAVVRLLATRELQRLEMPDSLSDIIDFTTNPALAPPNLAPVPLFVLPAYPQATQRYLAKVNQAGAALIAAGVPSASAINQLFEYDSAECLYMILSNGGDESWLASDQVKEIGDSDGDGLPEFQDAWIEPLRLYTAIGPGNKPISFIRWPAGFFNNVLGNGWLLSDYQNDVFSPNPSLSSQTQLALATAFSLDNHDYFDPLKQDIPTGSASQPLPRGYQLTPLIYSAGPDGVYGLVNNVWSTQSGEANTVIALTDPYFNDATSASSAGLPFYLMGQPAHGITGWQDNITNHLMGAE